MAAQIPDPDAIGRVAPQPSMRIASYEAGGPERAQEAIGHEISRFADRESAQIAVTQAQDALNQLAKKRVELTTAPPGQDGTGGGFRNVTGGKVLTKDNNGDTILKTYPTQFNEAANAIGASLTGPAARMFSERAQAMGNQFQADVMGHVMEQADQYHKTTLADTISTQQQNAALSPTNPVAVQSAVQSIKDAVAEYSKNPRAQDTTILLKNALSGVHRNVVDQAIAQGNPQYAMDYFNQNKKEMSPQDILQAEGQLTYSQRQSAAIGAATAAVTEIGWQPGRPLPTQKQVEDASIAKLGPNPAPADREATINEAQRQYRNMVQAHGVARENAISAAQQEIIEGNGQIPLSAATHNRLATYAPDYMASVANFMAAVDPAKEQQTNIAAYNVAVSHPDELARMSEADFLNFQTTNFAKADREKIANLRADYLNGKAGDSSVNLNHGVLNEAVNSRLASIDINPRPSPSDLNGQQRVDTIKHYIAEDIYAQQAQLGRKMTGPEIMSRIDQLFARSTELPGLIYGTNTKPTLAMKPGDIPSDERKQIESALSSVGVAAPTEDQILNTYWKWKAKNVR